MESLAGEDTIEARSEPHSLKFYCSWFCPYAQRVWICLEEIAETSAEPFHYQYCEIDPYAPAEDGNTKISLALEEKRGKYPNFVAASPRGLVPALDDNGKTVYESLICCEYLADCAPNLLMPSDAYRKAQVRLWIEHNNTKVVPFFYKILMAQVPEEQDALKLALLEGLRTSDQIMMKVSESGCFLGGNEFSLADVGLLPWWQRILIVLSVYREFVIPQTHEYQRLHDWWRVVSSHNSFRRARVSDERLISNYSGYAKNSATSWVAKTFR
jgi:glutathione S-transferase